MSHGHAWVFGASSGIGQACARRLLESGYAVTGFARRDCDATTVTRSLRCDIESQSEVERSIGIACDAGGPPRVVVYGVGMPAMGRTASIPVDVARKCFEVNFWGLDRVVRAVVPRMAPGGGVIVGILSLAALRPVLHEAYYGASKAAAARYLEVVGSELASAGIRLDYVAPGFIDTGFFERGGWYGMDVPKVKGSGVSPDDVASRVLAMVRGEKVDRVVGWREKVITLADRVAPGFYDRVKRWGG